MKRLIVFAHYDAEGEVKPYVLHHLRGLAALGGRLVFVSTAELSPEARELAGGASDRVISRPENVGYDFAMWAQAIAEEKAAAYDELVLTNSSVVGPIGPLADVFEAMREHPCDYWAMTESDEIAWHLQSWFMVFRRSLLEHPDFEAFWRSVLPYRSKDQVIRSYEVGLSTFLADRGHVGRAFFDRSRLPRRSAAPGSKTNVTLHHPLELLEAGVPYLKLAVIRDNPRDADIHALRAFIEATDFDLRRLQLEWPKSRASRAARLWPFVRGRVGG